MAAKGLKEMHDRNILHRDFKSDNILCNKEGDIKIADFGVSVFLSKQEYWRSSQKGTEHILAPEIVDNQTFGYMKEPDIWAFGIFLHELGSGMLPFHDILNREKPGSLFDAILNFEFKKIDARSDLFNDLMEHCLKHSTSERIIIDGILNHPYLEDAYECKEQWVKDYR